MEGKPTKGRNFTEEPHLDTSSSFTSDSASVPKSGNVEAGPTRKSKLGGLKKLFKSPAVARYEQTVTEPRKDWGTGNPPGGGPYRPLGATPGMDSYYTAKAGTGSG